MSLIFPADASDTLVYDIIERVVLILQTIPVPNEDGLYMEASDVFWDPTAHFPRFYVKFAGAQGLDNGATMGQPFRVDTLSFLIRMITGSITAEYLAVNEQNLNKLIFQVLRRFRMVPQLLHPDTGVPLRYLKKPFAQISAIPNGSRGIKFEDNGPLYVGCDFQLDVLIQTEVGRFTGQPGG